MFEDYAVMPLDLPMPPVDTGQLRSFLQTKCEGCAFTNNEAKYLLFYARKPVVDGKLLLHAADPLIGETYEGTHFDWDPIFENRFSDLVEWFNALPFIELHGVTLVTQTADIPEHMDIFGMNNSITYYEMFRRYEPRYYRVIFTLPGDTVARNQSFFVTQEYGGERAYISIPEGTSTIALSSSTCYHGATWRRGHYKTTAAIYGNLDVEKHLSLLRRSLDRYPDYTILLRKPGPVMGPAGELPYRGA